MDLSRAVPWTPIRTRAARLAGGGWPMRALRIALTAGAFAIASSINLTLAGRSIGWIVDRAPAVDWQQYVEAAHRLTARGDLYAVSASYAYHYSPLLAAVFGVISPIETLGWRALHLLAALALPTWPLRVLTLVSWPFWYDLETGNVLVFVLLAGAWALRGSRIGAGTFLLLFILIPRPLMLPVAAWLLWRQPAWRVPFAVALGVHTLGILALGWLPAWLAAMAAASGDVAIPSNVGPSRFIGTLAWIVIGVPLAAWLTWRGRVGLASIAISPYWLPYYLLMPLLDLRSWRPFMLLRRRA